MSLIRKDFVRSSSKKATLKNIVLKVFSSDTFNFVFWWRIGNYVYHLKKAKKKRLLTFLTYLPLVLINRRNKRRTGISLLFGTKIGAGLKFIHYSSIVIAVPAVIGKNCTIFQGVTIGHVYGGKNEGYPTIGDNVVLFAGAKVIGNVTVGNNVVVGANAVVTKDIPDNCVCVGIPAKVISTDSRHAVGNYFNWD